MRLAFGKFWTVCVPLVICMAVAAGYHYKTKSLGPYYKSINDATPTWKCSHIESDPDKPVDVIYNPSTNTWSIPCLESYEKQLKDDWTIYKQGKTKVCISSDISWAELKAIGTPFQSKEELYIEAYDFDPTKYRNVFLPSDIARNGLKIISIMMSQMRALDLSSRCDVITQKTTGRKLLALGTLKGKHGIFIQGLQNENAPVIMIQGEGDQLVNDQFPDRLVFRKSTD